MQLDTLFIICHKLTWQRIFSLQLLTHLTCWRYIIYKKHPRFIKYIELIRKSVFIFA